MTRLYFIRHGQSEANLTGRFAGHSDFPLTELGKRQAQYTADYVKQNRFTVVYTSDLSRAAETGRAVAELLDIPLVTDARLREIYAGEWEGRTFDELQDHPDFRVWRQQIGISRCTGGESVAELQVRVREAVESIVKAHPGQTVCIATHATAIRVMECLWTQTPLEQMHTIPWVNNASVTIVEYDSHMHGRLVSRDEHQHLSSVFSSLPNNV